MKEERFQEILVELERSDFREVLCMARDCSRQEHKEEELLSYFKIDLRFDWHRANEQYMVEAEEILPLLKGLSEESRFCLSNISITPVTNYADASGKEQQYRVSAATLLTACGTTMVCSSYNGDIYAHWQELRYRLEEGEEQVVPRSVLYPGGTVAQTPMGPLKVFAMDDSSLTLMLGTNAAELSEHKDLPWDCLPGLEAALRYGEGASASQWKRESRRFDYGDPVPSGCRVEVGLFRKGSETPEFTKTIDVRTAPCYLKMEGYQGDVFWNWPYAWGFYHGKMVVGYKCPRYDSNCTFWGLLAPGEQYTFPIDDEDPYEDDVVHHGQLTLRWENVVMGTEIQDGVLMSIPDVEEFVVPEEVSEMHFEALLTAPSLRKITLRPGVKNFHRSLNTYHQERCAKLEVFFEGSLQEWFDSAIGLAGHIGRLVVQGKEYDFYKTADLVIPEGVSRVGNNFFSNSKVLRSVVLPRAVVEVGDHAFAYCDNLLSVKVLGPASIGPSAFVSCKKLSDIELADGVVALHTGCFDFLTKVRSIFIPKSVKEVGGYLSSQNDGNYIAPVFLCAAPSKPQGWNKNWHLSYFDPRFGLGHGYDYYHPVRWGCSREEE